MYEPIVVHKIFSFLVVILSFWLGFWVFIANRRSRTNQFFFAMAATVSLWITLYYITIISTDAGSAVFWSRLAYGAVSIFYIPFYFFFVYFLNLEKKLRIFNTVVLLGGLFLSVVSVFTDWIVKGVILNGGIDLVLGKGSFGFYGTAVFLSCFIIFLLLRKYFQLSLSERLRVQYFLTGVLIWISMNFVFNILLPLWRGSVRYAEFGNYSAIFLLGFTAYAIVKKELFGMRVVLTSIMVGLIAVLLALDTLVFTSQLTLQILKGIILVIFLYFGYLLIKSVSEERKRREELEKLTSQLQVAHIRLSAAYEKLQRLDKAKSEFISIASHQLRTPLTAIKGYISMILEGSYGGLTAKLKKPLENVYQSNERLIKLVNDLLSISRIEAGRLELKFAKINIAEIIESVVKELKVQADNKKIKLLWENPAEPLPEILVDKEQIRQIVLNFIDNAIRYTNKGHVSVAIKRKPESLLIVISDTGEGMEKQEIALLFESFSRGQAGTRFWTEGTGLGLYVAKKFAEMNHGKVWAESEGKGKGSVFYIELPIA